MAKLSKIERKYHAQAEDLIHSDKVLSWDEKEFIFKNWNEGANHNNGAAGAFFTPIDFAFDFALDVGPGRIIDLCAGIGMLSFAVETRTRYDNDKTELVCIERNPDYLAVGKRLVPNAEWILADVLDVPDMRFDEFDIAISNPPFGNIKREKNSPGYSGKDFEFHVIDIASRIARYGVFIVPQGSAGFNYSGNRSYERHTSGKAFEFQKKSGLHFEAGIGIDTSVFQKQWRGVSPVTEIVSIEFDLNN